VDISANEVSYAKEGKIHYEECIALL